MDVIVIFNLGLFFTLLQPKKLKFLKDEGVPKIMIRWCLVFEIFNATDGRTDGGTDEQMEKVTYKKVGAPPRNDKIVKNNQSSINLRNCVNGKEIPENENPKKQSILLKKSLI